MAALLKIAIAFCANDSTVRSRRHRHATALAARAKQLRTRQAELAADLDTPPAAPSPADLDLIRDHIRAVVATGSPQERKSLYEALIDHIEITNDHTLTPVYRIPTTTDDHKLGGSSDPATSGNSAVRAVETMVTRTRRDANQSILVAGDPLPVYLSRSQDQMPVRRNSHKAGMNDGDSYAGLSARCTSSGDLR